MPKVTNAYKEQRRLEIIESAYKVFSEKGYTSMTMQDVMNVTGISRGALYSYFANKEDLYRAVIEHQDEEGILIDIDLLIRTVPLWPALREHFLYEESSDPFEEQIRKSIGAQYEYVVSGRSNDERTTWVLQRYHRIMSAYVALIKQAQDRGEFKPRMPVEDIVGLMISINDGINFGRMVIGPKIMNAAGQNSTMLSFLEYALVPLSN